jgi:hypothetical protein
MEALVLNSLTRLTGHSILATDGDVGQVVTAYFDDEQWTVRYLVVRTGSWLLGKEVLISPFAVEDGPWEDGAVPVALTREQVKNSPPVDTARPVSRQHELAYHRYYGYPYYWVGPGLWGAGAYPMLEPGVAERQAQAERDASGDDSHLRDAGAVRGHRILATDGQIGHVDDFLIDVRSWTIRYMVVDTKNWLGGRRVLIAPDWVEAISWEGATVQVALSRALVEASPEYEPALEANREFERRLYSHYGYPGYWETAEEDRPQFQLERLDTMRDLEVAHDDPDVRGWRVVGSDGRVVGKVRHLIADRAAMKVRFLEVALERDPPNDRESSHVLIPVHVTRLPADHIASLPPVTGSAGVARHERHLRAGFGPRVMSGELLNRVRHR